jgi:hypothetical protein
MRQRKQPFGCTMRQGRIVPEPQEAEMVQWIFSRYINGASYAQLAHDLSRQGVAYQAGKAWNKNMVARILADHRYLGQDGHPALLEIPLFEQVANLRPERYAPEKRDPAIKAVQRLAQCGCCGEKLTRISFRQRWQCPACNSIPLQISDNLLLESITDILNSLISNPTRVIEPPPSRLDNSLSIMRLQSELERELAKTDCNEDTARDLIRNIAVARFAKLDSTDYESERIRHLLSAATPITGINIELLLQITESVLIHTDATVSLVLRNEQTIEGSDD